MTHPPRLARYLRVWQLHHPTAIAHTATSDVYTVWHRDERVVLKLLTPIGVHDERAGAVALQHFDGRGAVRLLRHAEDAHLLEYAAGHDLTVEVTNGHDDRAAAVIAAVLQRLHNAPITTVPAGLQTLRRRLRALFVQAGHQPTSIYARASNIAEDLLATAGAPYVLHGDIHHGNIRHSARGWLAYDPKGLIGERTYDLANALLNPPDMPQITQDMTRLLRHARLYADAIGVTRDRALRFTFVHACLSASWTLSAGDTPDLTIARALDAHLCD